MLRLHSDPVEALALFREACRLEDGEGCRDLSDLLDDGTAGVSDPVESLNAARRGCDFGDDAACFMAATKLYAPEQLKEGAERAIRGCELAGERCTPSISYFAKEGQSAALIAAFDGQCTESTPRFCEGLAEAWYADRSLRPDAIATARRYAALACDKFVDMPTSCANASHYYIQGEPKDWALSFHYADTGCRFESDVACRNLRTIAGNPGVPARQQVDVFLALCDKLNRAPACDGVAYFYDKPFHDEAVLYREKACKLGYTEACAAAP